MLERSSNSPQARSKAQQAAEERPTIELARTIALWDQGVDRSSRIPHWAANLAMHLREAGLVTLPEVPDGAVIEAMARALNPFAWKVRDKYMSHPGHEALELDVMVEDSIRQARAAYAALRGAMQ